jgi:UDP-glucose 4-epimerase
LRGEVLNVGSDRPQTINHLVELLGGPKVHIPKRPGEPDQTWADNTRLRKLLGWGPRVGFEEGVRIMLKDIEHWRDAPVWTADRIAEATAAWHRHLAGRGSP